MGKSQNGWSAYPNSDDFGGLQTVTVGPVSIGIRKGDVATVLGYLMEQYHKRVEPLKKGACGCFNYRAVRAGSSLSNHASATAVDLCWNDHQLGQVGTFSASQVKQIKAILAECSGVVRWGGSYSGRKDEMHFEINADAAAVKRAAAKIKGYSAPKPTPPKPPTPTKPTVPVPPATPPSVTPAWVREIMAALPTVVKGNQGHGVKNVQGLLLAHGFQVDLDGVCGDGTVKAIKAFQAKYKLSQDGQFGPDEWKNALA